LTRIRLEIPHGEYVNIIDIYTKETEWNVPHQDIYFANNYRCPVSLDELPTHKRFFDVLLTVRLSIILAFDKLNAQILVL